MEEIAAGIGGLLLFAAFTGQRCTDADEIECGVNEKKHDGACVCETGYLRSYTGKCDSCDVGYLQNNTESGKLVCVSAEGDKRQLSQNFGKNDSSLKSMMSSTYDINKNNAMFRGYNIFDDKTIKAAAQYEKEGNEVPGVYPSFSSYKNVPFITNKEFRDESLRAASRKDWMPYNQNNKAMFTWGSKSSRMSRDK